jgi:hypothetical protein
MQYAGPRQLHETPKEWRFPRRIAAELLRALGEVKG